MNSSTATIVFAGDLDVAHYPEIMRRFGDCADAHDSAILDLTGSRIVDATFVGELLLFLRRSERCGRKVVVIARGDVARMLFLAGLDSRITIVSCSEAAAAAIADPWPIEENV